MKLAPLTLIAAACLAAVPAVPALAEEPARAVAADPVAKAEATLDRGLAFLLEQQQPDGTWQVAEEVPPAYTALALRALVWRDGPDDPAVKKGYDALLAQQLDDGGIYRDLLANYNTSIAVSALAAANRQARDGRYDDELRAGIDYLKRLQWQVGTTPEYEGEDQPQQVADEVDPFHGGWGYGGRSRGPGRPDLSNTQMSVQALRDAGLTESDPAFQRAVAFITRLQNHSDTNDQPFAGDDGGFIYGPAGDKQFESFAGEYVSEDGDRRLRSYGSMTYAGLKSMIYAGLKRDDPRVLAAVGWIEDNWTLTENPGMRLADPRQAQHGLYYYLLTLARALDAYDKPVLETPDGPVDWRLALVDELAALQNEDGSWTGDARWREADPVLVTAYVTTALEAAIEDLEQFPPEPAD